MNITNVILDESTRKYIKTIIEKGGPDKKEEYSLFRDFVDSINWDDVSELRTYLKPMLNSNTLLGRCFEKPLGYAGDYYMIDKMYQKAVNPLEQYKNWDIYCHEILAVQAVRNRKQFAVKILENLNNSSGNRQKNVLILGSGPVTEVYEFFCNNPQSNIRFDLLDMDERAINYAKEKNKDFIDKLNFINANVIRYRTDVKYDLIWSAGLFDYFKDKHFIFLMKKFYENVAEGGEIIIGNFAKGNPSKNLMEKVTDWFLHHRSPEELKKIALQAGIPEKNIKVNMEYLGINLFMHLKKE